MSQRRLHFIAQQKQQTACRVESDETQEQRERQDVWKFGNT